MGNAREVHISLSSPRTAGVLQCGGAHRVGSEGAPGHQVRGWHSGGCEEWRVEEGQRQVFVGRAEHSTSSRMFSSSDKNLPMRRNILNAIKQKLVGNKTVRFGEVEKFEPILHKKPKFSKCPWVDLAEIEESHDKETLQAAMRTWRFCATGLDGQEERSLMDDAFNAWKPKPKAGSCVLGWIFWIHLWMYWILHDSPSPAARDNFDSASINRSWP